MSHARVYINGQEAGYWPYGYNSFYVDATPYLKSGEKNELAVRLENERESSRWYPGAGLYRNVHLVVTEDVHIPTWGTVITTPVVEDGFARVNVKTDLVMPEGKNVGNYRIVTEILNPEGKRISSDDRPGDKLDGNFFNQNFVVYCSFLLSPVIGHCIPQFS